jgi:hypothetical protein
MKLFKPTEYCRRTWITVEFPYLTARLCLYELRRSAPRTKPAERSICTTVLVGRDIGQCLQPLDPSPVEERTRQGTEDEIEFVRSTHGGKTSCSSKG